MTANIAFLFLVWSIFYVSSFAANEKWFVQKLDHFNNEIRKTWKQKYYQSSEYYTSGGPAFLQIGGEGPANPVWMEEGHWIEIAKEVGAMCFMLEHRYYGDSHPTTNTSVENLQFLTSEQALADIAEFIHYFMMEAGLKTWITFGGSYSGSLSLWARLKYPHLIHGAVSASAPLLAKLDFKEYNEIVKRSLTDYGSAECVDDIAIATKTIETMLKTDTGRRRLQKIFQLCNPLLPGDYEYFQNTLEDPVAQTVQYNRDGTGGNVTISTICKHMTNKKLGTEVERYASLSSPSLLERFDQRIFFKRSRQTNDARGSCLDASYKNFIKTNLNPVFNASRTWLFQTCTEFGWYQSTDSTQQPFLGFPLNFFTDMCQKLYGSQYNATDIQIGIEGTNANYGGKEVSKVLTNAILFNGGVDPWHAVSYVNLSYNNEAEQSESFQTVFVPSAAHCAVMYPRKPSDPPELNDARDRITAYVKKLLE